MIKRNSFTILLAILFMLLSGAIYFIHYFIFRDIRHIFIYLVGDLAFLPLQVLLVALIIERVMASREQNIKLQKLNIIIGVFFAEIGNELLHDILQYVHNREEISKNLNINASWTKRDFQKAVEFSNHLMLDVDSGIDLVRLKKFLSAKRVFLLTLLENPSLLEHDRFTDLLWAVTHLDEELEARPMIDNCSGTDLLHIIGDIRRMYGHLSSEWLDYSEHLKLKYPYLFSLLVRTHPFQEHPSPFVM